MTILVLTFFQAIPVQFITVYLLIFHSYLFLEACLSICWHKNFTLLFSFCYILHTIDYFAYN